MPLEGLPDGVIYSGEIVHNGPAMRKNKTANPGINLRALRWPVTTRVGLLLRELACYYEKSIRRDRTGLRFRLCPGCQAIVLALNCCHSWRVDYWTRDYLTSKHRKRTGRRTVNGQDADCSFRWRRRGIRWTDCPEGPAQGRRYYALWMGADRQGQDREDQRQAGP